MTLLGESGETASSYALPTSLVPPYEYYEYYPESHNNTQNILLKIKFSARLNKQ
jgi:hypothetical protein